MLDLHHHCDKALPALTEWVEPCVIEITGIGTAVCDYPGSLPLAKRAAMAFHEIHRKKGTQLGVTSDINSAFVVISCDPFDGSSRGVKQFTLEMGSDVETFLFRDFTPKPTRAGGETREVHFTS